jgi:PTS system nitrogen regulatory IIA component
MADRAASALELPVEILANEIEKRGARLYGVRRRRLRSACLFPEGQEAVRGHGRLKQPIEFDAIDGQPVDIVFLLVLPAASQLDQLNALATVARKLRIAKG